MQGKIPYLKFHLAQFNIAKMAGGDINDPVMAGFVELQEEINKLGEQSPGFIWLLKGNGTTSAAEFRPYDDRRLIINLSVWEDIESLEKFVFSGRHKDILTHRKEWFSRLEEAYQVLWWIAAGKIPTIPESVDQLNYLKATGPSQKAFNFRKKFAPPIAADTLNIL